MAKPKRLFRSPDGAAWNIQVRSPGTSNAIVVFQNLGDGTSRLDRYNWFISRGPEAQNVTNRQRPAEILERLTDDDLALLFRRSMPISAQGNPLNRPPLARTALASRIRGD